MFIMIVGCVFDAMIFIVSKLTPPMFDSRPNLLSTDPATGGTHRKTKRYVNESTFCCTLVYGKAVP